MYKWFVFLVFAFTACSGSSSIPNNVLSYNDMKSVLWDMAQVDEFASVYIHETPEKIKDKSLLMYQKVFVLHKILKDEFAVSYTFYKSHPLQEKILMDSLLQFSTRQHQERYTPIITPHKSLKLSNPAPIRMDNMVNDWRQYKYQINFLYE